MFVPESDAERVTRLLREEITSLPRGTKLPSTRELAERFNVSHTTVAKGLATLKAERLVVGRQGMGNYRT